MDRISRCTWSSHVHYDPSQLRIIFFSSAPIWVPFLQALVKDVVCDVVGVVTMPDRPSGRGMKMQPNIIKQTARDLWVADQNIQTPSRLHPEKSSTGKNFYSRLQEKEADYYVVIAYGKIVPQALLDLPKIMPVNIHGSLLPALRGASPIQSYFLDHEPLLETKNQKKETWITLIRMVHELDAWDILATKAFPVPFVRTSYDIIKEMEKQWPAFLISTLVAFPKWYIEPESQDATSVTFCWKFEKEDGSIDPYVDTLSDIYQKYRAFALRPKIFFSLGEKRVIVEELILDQVIYWQYPNDPLFSSDHTLHPSVISLYVKPSGKSRMDWQSFVHWYLHKS